VLQPPQEPKHRLSGTDEFVHVLVSAVAGAGLAESTATRAMLTTHAVPGLAAGPRGCAFFLKGNIAGIEASFTVLRQIPGCRRKILRDRAAADTREVNDDFKARYAPEGTKNAPFRVCRIYRTDPVDASYRVAGVIAHGRRLDTTTQKNARRRTPSTRGLGIGLPSVMLANSFRKVDRHLGTRRVICTLGGAQRHGGGTRAKDRNDKRSKHQRDETTATART